MKVRIVFFLLIALVLFSACHTSGGIQNAEENNAAFEKYTETLNTSEIIDNENVSRDQAMQTIRNISNSTGDVDINSYPEMDKLLENTRYYYVQVVYAANKMSAAYYVDAMEGQVFIAMGGEIDTENPLVIEAVDANSISSESANESGITAIEASETRVIKDIFDCIGMTEEQIEEKFGSDYKKVFVNYDGNMEGLLYSDKGITVAFGNNGKATCVYCTEKIEINGAKSGLNFLQIQEMLGETSIRQTWVETPINTAYEIKYRFNGRIVVFFSRENEGNNSIMSIR